MKTLHCLRPVRCTTLLVNMGLPVRAIGTRLMIDGGEALAFLRGQWRRGNTEAIQEVQKHVLS
ncbi:MAG: hypothetical protein LLF97_07010 [Planctomycetaceae bacterium]|nr:hypothetical protein [Planctomycetaceae bacterium]